MTDTHKEGEGEFDPDIEEITARLRRLSNPSAWVRPPSRFGCYLIFLVGCKQDGYYLLW